MGLRDLHYCEILPVLPFASLLILYSVTVPDLLRPLVPLVAGESCPPNL